MAVWLHRSNLQENLADMLADVMKTPMEPEDASVLSGEIIIVHSIGVKSWLTYYLAKKPETGIAANIRFPYPLNFLEEVLCHALGDEEKKPGEQSSDVFHLMTLLKTIQESGSPLFSPVQYYLNPHRGKSAGTEEDIEQAVEEVKRFQLAQVFAETFERYLLFRPDRITAWDRGEEKDNWQAQIWRELSFITGRINRAQKGEQFIHLLETGKYNPAKHLPGRVHVFGIMSLPDFHLRIFAHLSRYMDIHFYLLDPSREYWGDLPTKSETRYFEKRYTEIRPDLHLEPGNSLLASMGKVGRDYLDRFYEMANMPLSRFSKEEEKHQEEDEKPGMESFPFVAVYEEEKNTDPADYAAQVNKKESLLSCIQSDIFHLVERGAVGKEKQNPKKVCISRDDASIRVHSCHTPMREVEVLFDTVLDMLENNPGLYPGDILVMAPDIDTYAPFIRAVFSSPLETGRTLPIRIMDQNPVLENIVHNTFFSILEMPESRFHAETVLLILEADPVRESFGLSYQDLENIRLWAKETRISWGIDQTHRKELGLPDFKGNTFMEGLSRLLLGVAASGQEMELFSGILPYPHMEGDHVPVLGYFLDFLQALCALQKKFLLPHTPFRWARELNLVLNCFFSKAKDDDPEILKLRRLLKTLEDMETKQGITEKFHLPVIRRFLQTSLEKASSGAGFISGNLTFCALRPMRSIPFPVICLLGMDAEGFPRQNPPPGFDMVANAPRKGDRLPRDDDRYLFLETLISARNTLHISYVGQTPGDNSSLPPSVLVSELLDYIEKGFYLEAKDIVNDHVCVFHRLHPFSRAYFQKQVQEDYPDSKNEERLFSFSKSNLAAAKALQKGSYALPPFFPSSLPEPEPSWYIADILDFAGFFLHPLRFLMKKRLGISYENQLDELPETEPFSFDSLEKYQLGGEIIENRIQGQTTERIKGRLKAGGNFPPGAVGRYITEDLFQQTNLFLRKLEKHNCAEDIASADVDIEVSGIRITGKISGYAKDAWLHYRFASASPKYRFHTFVLHLIVNCIKGNHPVNSILVGKDAVYYYNPIEDAFPVLEKLALVYQKGLCFPVPFFPETSMEYAAVICCPAKYGNKNYEQLREIAMSKAVGAWEKNQYTGRGESNDAYYEKVYPDTQMLNADFEETAIALWKPVFACEQKVE